MPQAWQIGDRYFEWGKRTYVMGVINLTPDSFSDGGSYPDLDAVLRAVEAIAAQVDILDLGGESTRPGAEPVSLDQELTRVVPAIQAIRHHFPQLPISVDTTKSGVARAALDLGAHLINDVSAGRFDPEMLQVAAKYQVPVILMHMQGRPRQMQEQPRYGDVVEEIYHFFTQAIAVAEAMGVPKHLVAIDPGIGFGKNLDHNLQLIAHLSQFQRLDAPILIGVSRKSFIGKLCNQPEPRQRLWGTAAACAIAINQGADILRVHDVAAIKDVCLVADAICREPPNLS
ncbi:MAG: dihydropteroate synthase [Pseudanabaenaceae cyanobacterium bins.68]|nr:dihydropteroate synthase [Pseudanabaenaceae cyanobacterium bins.68]